MQIATGEIDEDTPIDDGKDPAAKTLGAKDGAARANDMTPDNLTMMRMHRRRFTRLTNAFSKKFESHAHMVALYSVWYNSVRVRKTLRMSPAMAAGVSKTLSSMEDIAALIEAVHCRASRGAKSFPSSFRRSRA